MKPGEVETPEPAVEVIARVIAFLLGEQLIQACAPRYLTREKQPK